MANMSAVVVSVVVSVAVSVVVSVAASVVTEVVSEAVAGNVAGSVIITVVKEVVSEDEIKGVSVASEVYPVSLAEVVSGSGLPQALRIPKTRAKKQIKADRRYLFIAQ